MHVFVPPLAMSESSIGVISPLNAIMDEQVLTVNYTGTICMLGPLGLLLSVKL